MLRERLERDGRGTGAGCSRFLIGALRPATYRHFQDKHRPEQVRLRATFGGVILACLGTQNYFFTMPLALLIGGFGVFTVLWPERARQNSKKGNLVTSTSPLWWVRLVGMGVLVLALAGMRVAYHEARTNPNCMANQSSE